MKPDADAPETAAGNGFELKRRVRRILFEDLVITPSEFLNFGWQTVETLPKAR